MENNPKIGFFVNVHAEVVLVGKLYAEWTSTPSSFASFAALTSLGSLIPAANGTLNQLIKDFGVGTVAAK